MKTKIFVLFIAAMAIAALVSLGSIQQSANQLYQSGIYKEDVEGQLEEAITIYQQIIEKFPNDGPISAKAWFHIGLCHEKLGNQEAQKAYQQVLSNYADQKEIASQARARLAALGETLASDKEPVFTTRQLWTGPDVDTQGAPSPDGRYLSFTDWETGDLAVRDLRTGANRRLTNKGPWEKSSENAEFSTWSPDGKLIAYDWYDGKSRISLRTVGREGGEPNVLSYFGENEWIRTYDWSRDGGQILVFHNNALDNSRQIMLVSAADGTSKVVKGFKGRTPFPINMCFSPDGRYIAYDLPQEGSDPNHDIFLTSVAGDPETPLIEHPANDQLMGCSPDGKGILFASDRTGSLDMWFLSVSDGKPEGAPELIKGGIEQIWPLGFTQNGAFYYAPGRSMLDVYVARMDPRTGKILAPPEKAIKRFEGVNSWPRYSPDGKYLAYVTSRNRLFESALRPNILCIRSLETGKDQEFSTGFRRLAGLRWSPDGRFVYVGAWSDRGMGIYRVDRQSGIFVPVVQTEAPVRLHYHEISPDGNIFIYERRDKPDEPFRILSRNLKTGEEKQIFAGERNMYSISPDGKSLALLNNSDSKILQVIPVSGGVPTELLRFPDRNTNMSIVQWTPDGKYIVFSRAQTEKDKEQLALWRIAANGGESQPLNLAMVDFQDLSINPDGQHLVFDSPGFVQRQWSVWVLENFLTQRR